MYQISPKGGKPWSRELRAIFRYDQELVKSAGIIDDIFGGAAGITVSLLNMKFKIPTPLTFVSGYFWGQIDSYKDMQERMDIHDKSVEYHRSKKKQL